MPDSADYVQQMIADRNAQALIDHAARVDDGPKYTGYCLYSGCGDDLAPPRRWCNAKCRDNWERIEKCRRLSGCATRS